MEPVQLLFPFLLAVWQLAGECRGGVADKFDVSNLKFSTNFLKVAALNTTDNVISSPLSASILYSMLQQGARGKSLEELSQALFADPQETLKGQKNLQHYLKTDKFSKALEMASKMFLEKSFTLYPEFASRMKDDFSSEVELMSMTPTEEAAEHMNSWVSKHTHDKIKDLIKKQMLNDRTALVLISAVFFSDRWKYEFQKDLTRSQSFHISPEKIVQVPTMERTAWFATGGQVGFKFVFLEFKDMDDVAMLVIVPDEERCIDEVLNQLTDDVLLNVLSLSKTYENVQLSLPKFNISSDLDLVDLSKKLGIKEIFEPFTADLSGITPNTTGLYVSAAVQKATFDVGEKGATVTSGSAAVVGFTSSDIPPKIFNVDRPFLVFIVDTSHKVPLFAGAVRDPRK